MAMRFFGPIYKRLEIEFHHSTQDGVHWVVPAAGPVHGRKEAGEIL